MEKQRAKSRYRLFSRLLTRFFICTFFFFSSDFLFSQSFREKINSLEIVASENQNMYIKTDLKFEVEIPDVLPSSVQVKNTDFPDNVNLKSLRKFESFENNSATKLEFWLSFDKVGTYKFSKPLKIGDKIEFEDAAGYSMVKMNWFNGVPMPSIVIKRLNGKIFTCS